jgi:hypothetical protein
MFVRWGNLSIEAEEQRRLPGYRDEAVVRRFDAPEALETLVRRPGMGSGFRLRSSAPESDVGGQEEADEVSRSGSPQSRSLQTSLF